MEKPAGHRDLFQTRGADVNSVRGWMQLSVNGFGFEAQRSHRALALAIGGKFATVLFELAESARRE